MAEHSQKPAATPRLHHVLVKWTGSKRRQAKEIVAQFPHRIETYYEPFLGGGSVLYELLGSDIEVGRFECSDICEPLIALWQVVKDDPGSLVEEYRMKWRMLQQHGAVFFREVRREFNLSKDPHLLFFLLRTCRVGHVRFNRAGEFNGGFHGANLGMAPETVESLVEEWGRRLGSKDVRFIVRDYRRVVTEEGDLLYLDPPYETGEGRYYGGKIDFSDLFGWLRKQRGDHLLSLNGFLGDDDRRVEVPPDLYDRHLLLENGDNPFDRLESKTPRAVSDSLYIRRRSAAPRAEADLPRPESNPPARKKLSKSAEIRALLEVEADLTGPEVVLRLGERGIEVDANLVRVVRHNVRKATSSGGSLEQIAGRVLSRLGLESTRPKEAGAPSSKAIELTLHDLMALAGLIGGQVSEDQLFLVARAVWLVRHSQASEAGPDSMAEEFARLLVSPVGQTPGVTEATDTDNLESLDAGGKTSSAAEPKSKPPRRLSNPYQEKVVFKVEEDETEDDKIEEQEKIDRLGALERRWTSRIGH